LGPLAGLTALQSLDCSRTQVTGLSPLAGLAALQRLTCWSTQVMDLGPLAGLTALQSLDCSRTQVTDLGPLAGLTALQSLDCSDTQVTDLGPLAGLTALQSLNCWSTQVTDLGPLAGLIALQSLNCSRTQVTNLGPLAGLTALQSLNCSGCRLRRNYPEIWFKESMHELYLYKSHVPDVPAEVLSQSTFENCSTLLRAHLVDANAGAFVITDFKLLLLGNGHAGKTQIRHRLCRRDFEEAWDSTHGVRVESAAFAAAEADSEIKLHIWDFGGQDIYHGTHALFVRSAAVAMLVWARDTENADEYERDGLRFRNHRLQYWAEFARRQGHADSPVLVVQTKCDRVEDEVRVFPIPAATIGALPYCKQLHYSARNDRGRAALDEALRDAITWLRDPVRLGAPRIGAGRVRVRRRLEELRDADAALPVAERRHRTLNQQEFRQLCEEAGGVSSPDHLLLYLSHAGVVFYRQGLFDDRIVLDQAWALDAIYAVFQRERCYQQLLWMRGRFTRAMLELLVWQEHGLEEQNLFLSMMRSCGICFVHREAGDATEYVAPDLLPERATVADELAEKWPADAAPETVTFVYELLHPGLARDVIAKIGSSAGVNALYWRGGVCVYEAGTRSRGLIEQELAADGSGRIHVRTQGGQAALLMQRLVWKVEAAQERLGLRAAEIVGTGQAPIGIGRLGTRGQGRDGGRARTLDQERSDPPLDFRQPPVPEAEWYVSYAWGDASPDGREREAVVDRLCEEAKARGIRILRDKEQLGLGDSIMKFMGRLGEGKRVFVFLSEKYLRSPYCMFELSELWRMSCKQRETFLARTRVFVIPGTPIYTPEDQSDHAIYWKERHDRLEAKSKVHGPAVLGESGIKQLSLMHDLYLTVADILATMAGIVLPRSFAELVRYGFEDVVPGRPPHSEDGREGA
ncbi:MAG: leucine-rich repeat domain-containing protein, partial [Geminicoccaceae bacterium]